MSFWENWKFFFYKCSTCTTIIIIPFLRAYKDGELQFEENDIYHQKQWSLLEDKKLKFHKWCLPCFASKPFIYNTSIYCHYTDQRKYNIMLIFNKEHIHHAVVLICKQIYTLRWSLEMIVNSYIPSMKVILVTSYCISNCFLLSFKYQRYSSNELFIIIVWYMEISHVYFSYANIYMIYAYLDFDPKIVLLNIQVLI